MSFRRTFASVAIAVLAHASLLSAQAAAPRARTLDIYIADTEGG
ncbi:MAG: hypothetical protein ACJ79A_03705 [Gemmatimonadaceae bacterium]